MEKFRATDIKKQDGIGWIWCEKSEKASELSLKCQELFQKYDISLSEYKITYDMPIKINCNDVVFLYGSNTFIKSSGIRLSKQNVIYDDLENWMQADLYAYRILLLGYQEYIDICDNKVIVASQISEKIIIRRLFSNGLIQGKNNVIRLGKILKIKEQCLLNICGNNAYIHMSDNITINSLEIQISTKGRVVIQEDTMIGKGVEILQTDQHMIFDKDTGLRINQSEDVHIGKHVWLGRECVILGGANIADNSIVGARSVTSSKFSEKNSILAGSPAKIIRRNIIWARDSARFNYQHLGECKDKNCDSNMKSNIKINIWGSCVSRDIFELEENNFFKVGCYVGRNGIISSLMPPIDIANLSMNGWENRMVLYDLEKKAYSNLEREKSDFLLIDLIDERFGLLEIKSGVLTTYITYSQVLKRSPVFKKIKEKNPIKVIDQDDIGDYLIEYYLKEYCEKIKAIYSPNQIILNEAMPVKQYITLEGNIEDFNNTIVDDGIDVTDKYRERLKKYYGIIEKNFGNQCHIIKMPDNTFGYEGHKWGLASTHFTDQYYKYMLDEIKKIIH